MPPTSKLTPSSSQQSHSGARVSHRNGHPSRSGISNGGSATDNVTPCAHVETIGVKRTAYGTSGVKRLVLTNHFPVTIPDRTIIHYDVVITPSEMALPVKLNMALITALQKEIAPEIFTPRAVYDGRKNLFSVVPLQLTGPGGNSQEFDVPSAALDTPGQSSGNSRGPKIYKIKIKKVNEINPTILARFVEGKQSYDNDVSTAIAPLNIALRMEPLLRYPSKGPSFFTNQEQKDIGGGIVLCRGYSQSIRPAIGKMLVNVNISTGMMYKPGPLLDLCLEFIGRPGVPTALAPKRGFTDHERIRLQRFLSGICVITTHTDGGRGSRNPRIVKRISPSGAADLRFQLHEGGSTSVSEYFRTINRPLRYPDLPCVELKSGALIPIELCTVPEGQIMRQQAPSVKTEKVLEFATIKPGDRLRGIQNGLSVPLYSRSKYIQDFGMRIETNPLSVGARILSPPTLKYGAGSKQVSVTPRDGAWDMVDKRFYRPAEIVAWVVVVYERQQRFRPNHSQDMVKGLLDGFRKVGIKCYNTNPEIRYENGQGCVANQLRAAGAACKGKTGVLPSLIVAILPEAGSDIYTAIKYFGDCIAGVATQCLESYKCIRTNPQYYADVCLKINVKLGGINAILDPASVRFLTDPVKPTVVMGADVVHPTLGSEGRPSVTSVVANVDSDATKYVATSRVQASGQEIIEDLDEMSQHVLNLFRKYRRNKEQKANFDPKRILFYRDGVAEGQFTQVLEKEVPQLKSKVEIMISGMETRRPFVRHNDRRSSKSIRYRFVLDMDLGACKKLGIDPIPKITFIVVGKRHHVRFFPAKPKETDRSGNCPAGTVVDRDVAHPTEFDFYLQSHTGLLGTSRPAHYNVLLDENNFTPDDLQQLSFALCHVYARTTRSVSIPAPVYYADIVCSRAQNRFDPQTGLNISDPADQQSVEPLEAYKKSFKPLHPNAALSMYFS